MVRSEFCECRTSDKLAGSIPILVTNGSIEPSLNVKPPSSSIGPGIAKSSCMDMNKIVGFSPLLKILHGGFNDSIFAFLFMSTNNRVKIS